MDTLEKTLPEIVQELGITSTIKWQDTPATAPDWAGQMNAYRVTLNYQGRKMSFNYYQGKAVKHEPSTADAVWTLASENNTMQSCPTLKDFGDESGWDENTITTYRAVKNLAMRYKKLIGNEEILEMIGQVEY